MAYRLNEDNSILYNGNVALLKAANDVGKNTLVEILKVANGASENINVLFLNYVDKQKAWLNVKGQYILFNMSDKEDGVNLVNNYQQKLSNGIVPNKDTQVANVSGGLLATDGGIPIHLVSETVIDVPKETDTKAAQLKNKTT